MSRKRNEFSKAVREAAWQRCGGFCEGCTNRIVNGNGPQYDHIIPDAVGGPATLDNCQVLCTRPCHATKTASKDVPAIARTRRLVEKRANIRTKKGRPMQGNRNSKFKRKMDGSVVER
jgi:5-methylcytosine-specific restriction enzyme A